MPFRATLLFLFATAMADAASPAEPMPDGEYVFTHRYAEHPSLASITLAVRIEGRHVVVLNEGPSDVFPEGVIDEGWLMWHTASGQWIIGHDEADKDASEVGGCSDGPAVIDLEAKVYWTC